MEISGTLEAGIVISCRKPEHLIGSGPASQALMLTPAQARELTEMLCDLKWRDGRPAPAVAEIAVTAAPATFSRLLAWIENQTGRGCMPHECRAYVEWPLSYPVHDGDPVERAVFVSITGEGVDERTAVADFVKAFIAGLPGTDRLLVRTPLRVETHASERLGMPVFLLSFRAARVAERYLTRPAHLQPQDASHASTAALA